MRFEVVWKSLKIYNERSSGDLISPSSVILINCATRLVFNLTAAYMPFYMQMSTEIGKLYVALIPLIQEKVANKKRNVY